MLTRSISTVLCLILICAAGCTGSSVSQQHETPDRAGSTFTYTVDLIAGAGQGWPCTGDDAGDLTARIEGGFLDVTYTTHFPYYLTELHLDVGDSLPDFGSGVSNGLFPWSHSIDALNESEWSYTFHLPLSGEYPKGSPQRYRKGGYDWATGETLYITAHAQTCYLEEPDGGSVCRRTFSDGSYAKTLGLYAGNDDQDVGNVVLTLDGAGNLVVTVNLTDQCAELDEVHMYIGPVPPESENSAGPTYPSGPGPDPQAWQTQMTWDFGWGPFVSGTLPAGATTYTFTVPLADIAADCADCDTVNDGPHYYFGLHASASDICPTDGNDSGWSATAWNSCAAGAVDLDNDGVDDDCQCRHRLLYHENEQKPEKSFWGFKSYDSCALAFGPCVEEPGNGDEPVEICETAYGFDLGGNPSDECEDEWGWFLTRYPGVTRWGWTTRVVIP